MLSFWQIFGILVIIVGAGYAMPQIFRSIQRGNSKGLSKWFIGLWALDRGLSLIYVTHLQDVPLMVKYAIGLIGVTIIAFYKRND